MEQMGVGLYQTACEGSPNKHQIDVWLNEGKASAWISRELKKVYGETISDKSVAKYRKYREELIQRELETTPEYQTKLKTMNENLLMGIDKIKTVDVMSKLTDIIEQSADMLSDAHDRDIQINDVKDMRMIQQTMLDAIRIYGETVVKAQKVQEISKDPSLLRPTNINFNIKSTLTEILKGVMGDGNGQNFDVIDRLRNAKATGAGSNVYDTGGFSGDIIESGCSIVDGNEEDS